MAEKKQTVKTVTPKSMNIYQKLAAIGNGVDVVVKKKKGYNYSYADITEILAKVTAGMKKYHVALIPHVLYETLDLSTNEIRNTAFDRAGNSYEKVTTEMVVKAGLEFKWLNEDDPEDSFVVPWVIVGAQSDPSQAFGSSLTYCTRYFLTNFFHVAMAETAKDVDTYRSEKQAVEQAESIAVANSIVKEIKSVLTKASADHPDKKEEYKKFVGRYVKGAAIDKIKDPAVASKLLNDFKTKYLKEEDKVD